MRGTCKNVNFSWLLFATILIGRNLLTHTHKKHPLKMDFQYISFRKLPFCRSMYSELCEESVLRHNKRNFFPSYQDHYLNKPS